MKKIIVVGSGGREHAIAWRLAQSPSVESIVCVPGNGGTSNETKCSNVPLDAAKGLPGNPYVEIAKKEGCDFAVIGPEDPLADGFASSGHLMLVRLSGRSRSFRDELINRLAEAGIGTNVHYKPLPMLTAYRNLGFDIANFPNALAQFENEITLPLHTLLSDEDIDYILDVFACCKRDMEAAGLR